MRKFVHIPTGKLYTVNGAGGLLPVDGSTNSSLPLWLVENSKDWVNENDTSDNVPEWKKRDMVSKIVDMNCKVIPYEGTEVDKSSIVEEVLTLMKDFMDKHPNIVPKDDTFEQCVYCGHYNFGHFHWCDRPSKIN